MQSAIIHLAFFLSGASGLIYQVCWVRSFGNIFGNSIYSATVVTTIFMLGLGLGALWAGRIADRARAPSFSLRAYVATEFLIAGFGLFILWVIPFLEPISSVLSSYRVSTEGWHELSVGSYFFRYGAAALLLFPPAVSMGATLTFLVRYFVAGRLDRAGYKSGWLFGWNTLGAALGSLGTDFFLVPALGVAGTQTCAVALNVVAGSLAWLVLRRSRSGANPLSQERDEVANVRGLMVALAIFLAGAGGMGLEIIWFRFLSSGFGQNRGIFSLLLALVLTGIWLGSSMGGYLSAKFGRPERVLMAAFATLGFSVLWGFYSFDFDLDRAVRLEAAYRSMPAGSTLGYEILIAAVMMLKVIGVPAICMGFGFPLANALGQKNGDGVGRVAGMIYLGNTLGAVAGSLLAGFFLLPYLGLKWAIFICVALVFGAAVATFFSRPIGSHGRKTQILVCGFFILASASLLAWARIPNKEIVWKSFVKEASPVLQEEERIEKISEGLMETIVIARSREDNSRTLFTNGHPMSATSAFAQRYMRAMVHLPLLNSTEAKRVLVICFGVGNTTHSASLYRSVERIEVADLSRHVLEHAAYFTETNFDVIHDPRVKIFVNDGRQHLRMREAADLDLITLEPPPVAFAGVSSLYSREFYQLARENLRDGGYITQWIPVRQFSASGVRAAIRAFLEVFPGAFLVSGEWGELILMGRKGAGIEFNPQLVKQRLLGEPAVARDLERWQLSSPLDFAGVFLASPASLAAVVDRVSPVTDDDPVLEYMQFLFLRTILPVELFDPRGVMDWCPRCFIDPRERRDHWQYAQIMGRIYHSAGTREVDSFFPKASVEGLDMGGLDGSVISKSPYLRGLLKP